MNAGRGLRKLVSRRLMPLAADLEEFVFEHGYLRSLASAVAALGSVGLVGQLIGPAWLRTIFATLAASLFLIARSRSPGHDASETVSRATKNS